jgi:hypothetical protein
MKIRWIISAVLIAVAVVGISFADTWMKDTGYEINGTTLDFDIWQQLHNIGTTTISATQWGYLGGQDQAVATTSAPTFLNVTAGHFIGSIESSQVFSWKYLPPLEKINQANTNKTISTLSSIFSFQVFGEDTYTNGSTHGQGDNAFFGGVLAPNGKVILVPFNSDNIGIYSISQYDGSYNVDIKNCLSPFLNKL